MQSRFFSVDVEEGAAVWFKIFFSADMKEVAAVQSPNFFLCMQGRRCCSIPIFFQVIWKRALLSNPKISFLQI